MNSRLYLHKLGWVRYRNSRKVIGEIRNVTVSHSAGQWFISIQTEREVGTPAHCSSSDIRLDVGVARFATLSDGSSIPSLNSFKRHQARLAKAQRQRARKVKFSKNWRKADQGIQRIHRDIANARRNHQHQTSTAISQTHAIVYVEDLQVKNMSASAAAHSVLSCVAVALDYDDWTPREICFSDAIDVARSLIDDAVDRLDSVNLQPLTAE